MSEILEPTATTNITSFEGLTGYSLPAGVTASDKPSDYTDLGVTAMKLPDNWIKDVRKRLPDSANFA